MEGKDNIGLEPTLDDAGTGTSSFTFNPKGIVQVSRTSSETQGKLVGAGKSLNGRKKIRAKKRQEGEKE